MCSANARVKSRKSNNIFHLGNMTYIPTYKDSLRFNQYDSHVIVCGLFNDREYFTAKVINVFPVAKFSYLKLVLIEVILLYKIYKQDGIFVKRHLQNYKNIHTVLVSQDIGRSIEASLRNVPQKYSVLISFAKRLMHGKNVIFDKQERRTYFFILPGMDVVTTTSNVPIHYVPPSNFYSKEYENVPHQFPKYLNIKNFVHISELDWHVIDLKVTSLRDKNLNTEQSTKSADCTKKSVLRQKIVHVKEQSNNNNKECICSLRNRKSTKPKYKTKWTRRKKIEQSSERPEVRVFAENKENVPFRIIDEMIHRSKVVSHPWWMRRK